MAGGLGGEGKNSRNNRPAINTVSEYQCSFHFYIPHIMATVWSYVLVVACFSSGLKISFGMSIYRIHPVIKSVAVINESQSVNSDNNIETDVFVQFSGSGFIPGMEVKFTPDRSTRGDICPSSVNSIKVTNLSQVWLNTTVTVFRLGLITRDIRHVYTCVKVNRTEGFNKTDLISTLPNEVIKWLHQGDDGAVKLHSNVKNALTANSHRNGGRGRRSGAAGPLLGGNVAASTRGRRSPPADAVTEPLSDPAESPDDVAPGVTRLYGLRIEESSAAYEMSDGAPELLMGSSAVMRLFGDGFTRDLRLVLTDRLGELGDHCEYPTGQSLQFSAVEEGHIGLVRFDVPSMGEPGTKYYLCYKVNTTSVRTSWTHMGSKDFQCIKTYRKLLPLWVSVIIILVCLTFSSLFSGLNLGLMSLDQTDLKIIANTGTEQERKYAKVIKPIRHHGNYLLCSILLGNVMVNSTFTILLDDLTSGLVAVLASTLMIVIFGEITPQAICSRHGLAVGAKTINITKMVMLLTFPLSYPISKILDKVLGEEIGAVFTRERLKELVKLNTGSNIKTDELNIISGVLELTEKKVCDVMTRIEDVYMLSIDTVLDFETVSNIMKSGFSRIPVYENHRTNIVTVLYIKDLALVDPDDNLPIKTVCEFYQNNCFFIFEDTPLDYIFRQFKEGSKGHMAFVHRVNNEGEGDPFYETVGIVTLEDVIEELIQSEIVDETDVYTDNKSKKRRQQKYKDFTEFAELSESQKVHISPHLTLATFQFLSTSVDPFKSEFISGNVLKRVLKQNVFCHIKIKNKDIKDDPSTIIYDQGKPADYFVLILEGRVEVKVGKEGLLFESGPFTYFGSQALIQNLGVESPCASGGGVSLPVTNSGGSTLGSLQSVVQLDSKLRFTFVPDYSVKAITEVIYLKLPRSLYLAAKRATLMQWSRKGEESLGNVDNLDDVFEKLINTYEVDDTKSQGTPEVTRTCSQVSGNTLKNGSLLMACSEPSLTAQQQTPLVKETNEENTKLLANS